MAQIWNQNDLVKGDNLLLWLTSGKTVVAYATSCSLQTDAETIDTSSKFSSKWANAMGGKASYTISADALYCNNETGISFDKLLEFMVKGEAIDWYIGQEQGIDVWNPDGTLDNDSNPHTLDTEKAYYNGKGVITSCSLEAGNNEIASCSISITGAGELRIKDAQIK